MLLTFDGELLLAFDAVTLAPKWTLEFSERIHTVLFASTSALPRVHAGNPWRAPSSGSDVLVIDVEGSIHAVDPGAGQRLGSLPPIGAPLAVAASPLGALAIALGDRVLLWNDRVQHTLALRGAALAFSRDGRVLAVGAGKELREVDVATRAIGPARLALGAIQAIAPRHDGEWVVVTDAGVQRFFGDEEDKLAIKAGTSLALGAKGEVLAVQHAVDRVVVYEWPAQPTTRVAMAGRTISGIALDGDRLAVAVTGGDANVVNLAKRTHRASKEHAGRTSRRWALTVESEKDASARKDGATRFGLGSLLTLAIILVCMGYLSSSAHQSWVPPPPFLVTETCDATCARTRLEAVRASCAQEATLDCVGDADEAVGALKVDACDDARAALGRVRSRLGARDDGGHARFSAQLSAAEMGLVGCHR